MLKIPTEVFPGRVGGGANAAICEVGFQVALRLDELIDLIRQAEPEGVEYIPGTGIPATPAGRNVFLIELVGLQLASFPRDHNKIAVTTTATPLMQNLSQRWMAVAVTNNGNSQEVRYGTATALADNAPLIPAKTTEKIVIPPNETLYAIVDSGSVDVAISTLATPRLV